MRCGCWYVATLLNINSIAHRTSPTTPCMCPPHPPLFFSQALLWERDALLSAETALLRYRKRLLSSVETSDTTAQLHKRQQTTEERLVKLRATVEGPPTLPLLVPAGEATQCLQGVLVLFVGWCLCCVLCRVCVAWCVAYVVWYTHALYCF